MRGAIFSSVELSATRRDANRRRRSDRACRTHNIVRVDLFGFSTKRSKSTSRRTRVRDRAVLGRDVAGITGGRVVQFAGRPRSSDRPARRHRRAQRRWLPSPRPTFKAIRSRWPVERRARLDSRRQPRALIGAYPRRAHRSHNLTIAGAYRCDAAQRRRPGCASGHFCARRLLRSFDSTTARSNCDSARCRS